jgi:exonuclease SbcC
MTAATEKLGAVERAIDVLIQRGGDGDADELAQALTAAEAAVEEATALADQVERRTGSLAELRDRENRLQEQFREVGVDAATVTEKIAASTTQLGEIRARVAAAAGDDPSVEDRGGIGTAGRAGRRRRCRVGGP